MLEASLRQPGKNCDLGILAAVSDPDLTLKKRPLSGLAYRMLSKNNPSVISKTSLSDHSNVSEDEDEYVEEGSDDRGSDFGSKDQISRGWRTIHRNRRSEYTMVGVDDDDEECQRLEYDMWGGQFDLMTTLYQHPPASSGLNARNIASSSSSERL